MEANKIRKYKQFQKCYTADRHYKCIECNAVLDNLPIVNFDRAEEIGQGHEFLLIQHGVIYHEDLNSDLETHRIDRLVLIEED